MAKEKRFPSPANVEMTKEGKPMAPKVAGPLPEQLVEGKKVKLLSVHYAGKNNVVLHNGVHALAPGLNQVPDEVMEEAKLHPHTAKLIKDGLISFPFEQAEPKSE